jgi:hypothetical protein
MKARAFEEQLSELAEKTQFRDLKGNATFNPELIFIARVSRGYLRRS